MGTPERDDRMEAADQPRRLVKKTAVALALSLVTGGVAAGLGIPVWIVVIVLVAFAALVVFES